MIGLAAIAAVMALVVATIAPRHHASPAPPVPADCIALATHAERARCLNSYFHDAARSGKTRGALRALTELVRSGALDDCHHLAHDFGHVGFEVSGTLAAAIHAGDADCLKGYYHGVVEAAVQHAAVKGVVEIVGLCTSLRGDGVAYGACVHGIGHGLMRISGDATQARRACASLPDDYARDRCAGGVFMENSMRHLDLDTARYRASAPRACDGIPPSTADLDLCDQAIGEIAMFYYRHDLNAALGICRAIGNGPADAACERGARDELDTSRLEHRPG